LGEQPIPLIFHGSEIVGTSSKTNITFKSDIQLHLRIYEETLDYSSEEIHVNRKKLFDNVYLVDADKSISKLHSDIYDIILKEKGDGLDIISNLSDGVCIFSITLIHDSRYDYIVTYFKDNYHEASLLVNVPDKNYERFEHGLISINYHDSPFNEEDVNEIIEDLQKSGIKSQVVNTNERSYEHGAGSFTGAIILAIVSATTGVTVHKALESINDKLNKQKLIDNYIKYGDYDIEKLYLNVAKRYKDRNIKKCKVSKFDEIDGIYYIELISKDRTYSIRTDNDSTILDIRVVFTI